MNRLQKCIAILGYQGGHHSMVNKTIEGCLERPIDIISMSNEEFDAMLVELEKYWPSYIEYCREQYSDSW